MAVVQRFWVRSFVFKLGQQVPATFLKSFTGTAAAAKRSRNVFILLANTVLKINMHNFFIFLMEAALGSDPDRCA